MDTPAQAAVNTFAGLSLVLDRRAERRDDDAWIAMQGDSPQARYLVIDEAGETWLDAPGEALRWLDAAGWQACAAAVAPSFLGLTGTLPWFALAPEDADTLAAIDRALGGHRANLRQAATLLDAREAALFAYAKGLTHWQRETRHCARCGAPLVLQAAGHRARCTRAACARLHFPRTDAAIIAIVADGDACLLGHQASWPPGRYSTLAGFVEPGESLEDAVRREVAEETGVTVGAVRYHSSQPWPMPASLMVGFTATATTRAIQCRDKELEDARWFSVDELLRGLAEGNLTLPPPLSVSWHLIAHWLDEHGVDLRAYLAGLDRR